MDTALHARVAALPTPVIELLMRWTRIDPDHRIETIRPRNRALPAPLSFAQERLWFLEQLQPGNTAYNLPLLMNFEEPCEPSTLHRALNDLVLRHESLRTTFVLVSGSPVQRVSPALEVPFLEIDLRRHRDSTSETDRLLREEMQRPFDLQQGPLLRAVLIRRAERDALLIITMHHIVSDGWSFGVIATELNAFYRSRMGEGAAQLPELTIQYTDYSVWQREWLRGEGLDAQMAYWRKQLAGAPPLLELPNDKPRPPIETNRGAFQTLTVPFDVTESLRVLARGEDATLFMALLAGFAGLLSRYGGIEDMVIGSPIANRNRPELEGLIGFFVNMVGLRVRPSDRLSMRALIRQVRETTLGAHEHQELPFEKLVAELNSKRSLAFSPITQVAFVLQNTPDSETRTTNSEPTYRGWNVDPECTEGTVKYDLTVSLVETDAGLMGTCEYRTDLFGHRSIHRLLRRYLQVLASLVDTPDVAVRDLPIWLPDEPHGATTDRENQSAQNLAEFLSLDRTSRLWVVACDGEEPTWLGALVAVCTHVGANLEFGSAIPPTAEGITHVVASPECASAIEKSTGTQNAKLVVVGLPCFGPAWAHWKSGPTLGVWGAPGAPFCCALDLRDREATIARPLRGYQLEVLNQTLEPLPIDFWGELYIGIESSPSDTSAPPQSFADPRRPGTGLLRSGLRARWRDDGTIDVSGRADGMQRVDGMLIDPEQLAAILRQHPALADARVDLPVEGNAGGLRAVVVPRDGRRVVEHELVSYVSAHAPAGLIPKRIDIARTLCDAAPARPQSRLVEEPMSAIEAVMARIWSEVLGSPIVDVEANFFDLGGNSLNSVQVISRVRETLHVELELYRLFDTPTLAGLSAIVEEMAERSGRPPDDIDDRRLAPSLARTFALLGIDCESMSREDVLDLVYTLEEWEVDELLQQLTRHAGLD